jgi:hypothetical protein
MVYSGFKNGFTTLHTFLCVALVEESIDMLRALGTTGDIVDQIHFVILGYAAVQICRASSPHVYKALYRKICANHWHVSSPCLITGYPFTWPTQVIRHQNPSPNTVAIASSSEAKVSHCCAICSLSCRCEASHVESGPMAMGKPQVETCHLQNRRMCQCHVIWGVPKTWVPNHYGFPIDNEKSWMILGFPILRSQSNGFDWMLLILRLAWLSAGSTVTYTAVCMNQNSKPDWVTHHFKYWTHCKPSSNLTW